MSYFVGVDVGGTRIKAGLVDPDYSVSNEQIVWLRDEDKSESGIVSKIADIVMLAASGAPIEGIGLGLPGLVNSRRGVVFESPNFPAWHNFEITAALAKRLSVPVVLDNDANCVFAGESLCGAASDIANFIGLALGTGIGGAILLDGRLWRGERGFAGELGHINVEADGFSCGCGSRGCMEQYCSLTGLKNLCRVRPVPGIELTDDLPRLLANAAESGNEIAIAHFETAGRMLGRGIATLVNSLNISNVVLAGGMSHTFGWMEKSCREEIESRAYTAKHHKVQLRVGTLGERAGIIGAAMQQKLMVRTIS